MPQLPSTATVPKRDYDFPDMSDRGEKHHVSHSELSCFRDCPLKWLLQYFWKVQPPVKDVRLDRGSAWHSMLEAHYYAILAGGGQKECYEAALKALNDYALTCPAITAEEFETLMWMYNDYSRIYGRESEFRTLALESEFEFEMPVDGAPKLVIVGKIDRETERVKTGTRQVWDHKSAGKRDVSKDGFTNEMLLDDQFPLYAAAKRRAGEPCDTVILNAARTDRLKRVMLDAERFHRVEVPYTDAALDAVWEDYRRTAQALIQMWNDPERVYSVPNPKQCGWKCSYQRVHIESRTSGRPILEVAVDYGMTFKGREPVVVQETEGGGW